MTRNEAVIAAIRSGQSGAEVARAQGVSRERIRQIWFRDTGVRLPRWVSSPERRAARFWAKVDKSGDCWEWRGARLPTGYGRTTETSYPSAGGYAHRVAYLLIKGPIPEGLTLDHLCRNPSCVNPAHLEAVSSRENILRGVGMGARNARKTHCKHGHPFNADNTIVGLNTNGQRKRVCRACHERRRTKRVA